MVGYVLREQIAAARYELCAGGAQRTDYAVRNAFRACCAAAKGWRAVGGAREELLKGGRDQVFAGREVGDFKVLVDAFAGQALV